VAVNDVSSRSSIFDLISKGRAQFGPDVKAVLGPLLESWGLRLEDVMIREIHPPQEIVDKITEQQQMRAELQRINILKQQAVTEAQTTIIEAQKVAEQNRLLAQQGQQALALKKLGAAQDLYRSLGWAFRPGRVRPDSAVLKRIVSAERGSGSLRYAGFSTASARRLSGSVCDGPGRRRRERAGAPDLAGNLP